MTTATAATITNFRDLRVWQESVELTKDVYAANQMKRAAVSVASNIAEGHARRHRAEYRQYLHIAVGSLAELETQLHIAKELRFMLEVDSAPLIARVDHIRAMLLTLSQRLR